MINKTFILLLLLIPLISKADQEGIDMDELLFGSDLIVKSKIINHTDHYYTIRILDIYRDHQIGIKIGDHIRIKKEMNVETSVDVVHAQNIIDRLTGVAFLTKYESGWGIRRFPFFYNDKVTIRFDKIMCYINGTSYEIKNQIKAYFSEFHLDKDGNLIEKKTPNEIKPEALADLVLLQYTTLYTFQYQLPKEHFLKLNCQIEGIEKE